MTGALHPKKILVHCLLAVALVALLLASGETNAYAERSIRVVSLGDSYMAGVGNGNYYPDQGPWSPDPVGSTRVPGPIEPGTTQMQNCYQSYDSYPQRYVERLRSSGSAAEVWHAACGGAGLRDLRGQWESVPDAWRTESDIVLLSFGGNDAGFSNIVWHCLNGASSFLPGPLQVALERPPGDCDGSLSFADNALASIVERLEREIEWLAGETAARIVVVGYPRLASPSGEKCRWLARGESELDRIQSRHRSEVGAAIDRLNEGIGQRFDVVEVADAFAGRGPCADDGLLNHVRVPRYRLFPPGFVEPLSIARESFHPSAEGAQKYADLIFDASIHSRLATVEATVPAPKCGGADATIVGTDGDDVLFGTNGPDVIAGLAGNDRLYGLDGRDLICGGAGRDHIWGGRQADTVHGGDHGDRIVGGSGRDVLYGERGNDRILGSAGNDHLDGGGARYDVLIGNDGFDRCVDQQRTTVRSGCEL